MVSIWGFLLYFSFWRFCCSGGGEIERDWLWDGI